MKYDWKVSGHKNVIQNLEKDIETKRLSHAYIFSGPEAVGKLTVAKKFAELLGANPSEGRVFLDEGNPIGIDEIREMTKDFFKTSYTENKRVIIIENAERMSIEAENSILKFLEEPPKNLVIIFTTKNYFLLLPTIISRMRVMHFHLLKKDLIKTVIKEEKLGEEELEEALQIASGRIGILKKIIKDPHFLFETRENHNLFTKMTNGKLSVAETFTVTEEMSDKEKRENLKDFLESLMFFLRSLILRSAKKGDREQVISTLNKINIFRETLKNIERNANLRLSLENMILSF